ncbi:Hypothetical protein PHPALM_7858, partial [Phytophthora palmivora]
MQPEAQKPLDVVEKEARARNAAKRRAAREEKKAAEPIHAHEQPDSEDTIQGAHHVSLDEVTGDGQKESAPVGSGGDSSSDSSVEVVGVPVPDAPAQASVGGAAVVEYPAEEALVKPRPDEDVISVDDDAEEKMVPDETPTIKLEGPLSTVKEEVVLEDSQETSHLKPETSPPFDLQVLKSSFTSTPEAQSPSRSRREIDLTVNGDPVEREALFSVDQGRTYVADQVRRWEQVTLEFVMSPTIEYTLAPNAVVDFTSVEVYLKDLSPRECVAVLQTMFFDVGFRFRNLIPEWFRAHASQVDRSSVRAVAEDLQHLLTMELLEWREVTSGVPSRLLSPLDVRALTDPAEDVKPEDAEAAEEGGSPSDSQSCEFVAWRARAEAAPTLAATSSLDSVDEFSHIVWDVCSRQPKHCKPERSVWNSKRIADAEFWIRIDVVRTDRFWIRREQRRLTCRTLHPEWFSLPKAALRKSTGTDLPPRPPAPVPAARTPASPRTVDAARAEGAHTALESARVEFEERWQQREAKVEAEKVAWVADVQKILSVQLEAFQQKIHSLEEARNRDQETIRDLKNVQVKSEPTRATMYPLPGNAIKGHASERRDIKCDSNLPAEQLRLTLQCLTGTKYAKEDEAVKSEQTPGAKSSSVSRPKSQVRETKPVAPEKTDAKKPTKKDSNKKHSRQDEDLTGASSGGESSDETDSSSDS